jgi:predicted hydrolase (HD superfamily)
MRAIVGHDPRPSPIDHDYDYEHEHEHEHERGAWGLQMGEKADMREENHECAP